MTVDDVTSSEPPLFLQAGPQFTKLLIDTNVKNYSYPVIFIGTSEFFPVSARPGVQKTQRIVVYKYKAKTFLVCSGYNTYN